MQAKHTVTDFYLRMIRSMQIAPGDSVLVVCGEATDRQAFLDAGIGNVTISNIDDDRNTGNFAPYRWERQDAENLDLEDGAYDWVVVHAGLHHCASPHRALCEMLRVARKGIMAIESRDSLSMRAAVRFGLTYDFELEPVALSDGEFGGYRNTAIPNYVYRWTEREVVKTTASFVPDLVLSHRFAYGYRFPLQRMAMARSPIKRSAVIALALLKRLFETVLPRQGNQFGFVVMKTERLQPWLKRVDGRIEVDRAYVNRIYDTQRYPDQPDPPPPASRAGRRSPVD